ncbi:MBL fold metallo-hydrolase [Novosphingobium umbonatum]|nr:MBL fold metallo-hydrolase [Novosphingobium umbonatum]
MRFVLACLSVTSALALGANALAQQAAPKPVANGPLTEQQAASGQFRQVDQGTSIKAGAEPHFAAARKAAGNDFPGLLLLCNQARPEALRWALPSAKVLRQGPLQEGEKPRPAKLFDNLYYLGAPNVSAYAIDTSDGIILIDTLNNGKEAEDVIAGGLRQLGLDPARIKHVIITHGHGDHYGGAAWLQKTYHPSVWMSDLDWTLSPTTLDKPYFDPAPPRDKVITDGQVLKLGQQSVTMHFTPGHTQGTVSLIFSVSDHGKPHKVALLGGTGFNFPHSPLRFAQYAATMGHFADLARKAGANVILSNHPENDLVVAKSIAITRRKAGEPNALVAGVGGVQRYFTTLNQCALAYGEQMK